MTKLEELKAAYEAATQGEDLKVCEWPVELYQTGGATLWFGQLDRDGDLPYEQILIEQDNDNVFTPAGDLFKFIALSHNLMPTLLEAVDLLETLRYSMSQYDDGEWFLHEGGEEVVGKVDEFLEKLK